jgi:hypothetical protein
VRNRIGVADDFDRRGHALHDDVAVDGGQRSPQQQVAAGERENQQREEGRQCFDDQAAHE